MSGGPGAVKRLVPATVVLLLAAACGGGSAPAPQPDIDYPQDPAARVLSVLSTGGFTWPGDNLSDVPTFLLYGDGRLLTPVYRDPSNPQILPSIEARQISPEGIEAILRAAQDAGLFGPPVDYGTPGITDGDTTYLELQADGRTHEKSAYALGSSLDSVRMEPEDRRRRLALSAWYERMFDLEPWLPEGSVGDPEVLVSDRYLVFADDQGRLEDLAPEQPLPEWPLAAGLTGLTPAGPDTGCAELSRSEVDTILQAAGSEVEPNWTDSGRVFTTFLRPVLPDETDCRSVLSRRPAP
ncbi:MAG TPA: hypothetical protein VHL54_05570 [Actinomycetota bacterium]|nr:hypothetical protein [Actinomycetota bacterium]